MSACIARDCGKEFDSGKAETREGLRSFALTRAQAEIVRLRAVGPLPPKIAEKYRLTEDGAPLPPVIPTAKEEAWEPE